MLVCYSDHDLVNNNAGRVVVVLFGGLEETASCKASTCGWLSEIQATRNTNVRWSDNAGFESWLGSTYKLRDLRPYGTFAGA